MYSFRFTSPIMTTSRRRWSRSLNKVLVKADAMVLHCESLNKRTACQNHARNCCSYVWARSWATRRNPSSPKKVWKLVCTCAFFDVSFFRLTHICEGYHSFILSMFSPAIISCMYAGTYGEARANYALIEIVHPFHVATTLCYMTSGLESKSLHHLTPYSKELQQTYSFSRCNEHLSRCKSVKKHCCRFFCPLLSCRKRFRTGPLVADRNVLGKEFY